MIHILLMILKIIGIILLVILGLLLFVLLVVLFVPVRYKLEGAWHGKPEGVLRAGWFLHILSFRALYTREGGLKMIFKVFGFDLLKERKRGVAEAVEHGAEDLMGDEEQSLYDELQEDEARYRKAARERASKPSDSPDGTELGDGSSGTISSGDGHKGDDTSGNDTPGNDVTKDTPTRDQSGGIFGKLRSLQERIAAGIKGLWEKFKFSFAGFCGKLKGIQAFVQDKKQWLEDERNQASIKLLFRQTRRLIAHIWPVKGKGTLTFGFDDPYTTGQVLQAVSLIYPFYHKQLTVRPVFDEKVLDAEGSFRGRIRLAVVLWLAFQVYLDKHTRRMIRGFIK